MLQSPTISTIPETNYEFGIFRQYEKLGIHLNVGVPYIFFSDLGTYLAISTGRYSVGSV